MDLLCPDMCAISPPGNTEKLGRKVPNPVEANQEVEARNRPSKPVLEISNSVIVTLALLCAAANPAAFHAIRPFVLTTATLRPAHVGLVLGSCGPHTESNALRNPKKKASDKNTKNENYQRSYFQDLHFLLQNARTPEGIQKGFLKGSLKGSLKGFRRVLENVTLYRNSHKSWK